MQRIMSVHILTISLCPFTFIYTPNKMQLFVLALKRSNPYRRHRPPWCAFPRLWP